ncbi:chemotaxis protein CheW [Yoonia sp.]|uniref:chemotaxis protein CheW n=1 Tax=Yoonia sp. TaxID=2212373 RepID=UPI0019E71AD3|nr:chemotaxis protein CheW [Yoonia sp.]MBE0413991.1 purine-binding chemotaxis protein CheW [Yoonia sp.]
MSPPDENTQGTQLEFVTLVAGGQNFCIEITQIREIRRWSPVTILPHSPSHVLGVINLRGAVIPIIDLAAKLGFDRISPTERHVIIITAIEDRIVGLLVESVSEILGVRSDMVRETPRSPDDTTMRAILGVIAVGDDMTKVINLSTLLTNSEPVAA